MTPLRSLLTVIMILVAAATHISGEGLADDRAVFISDRVDTMPSFPGGEGGMMLFIIDNMMLDGVTDGSFSSDVMVGCVIGPDGRVSQVEVLNACSPRLAREIKRVIERLPHFTPATLEGTAVACRYEFPMSIVCEEE